MRAIKVSPTDNNNNKNIETELKFKLANFEKKISISNDVANYNK